MKREAYLVSRFTLHEIRFTRYALHEIRFTSFDMIFSEQAIEDVKRGIEMGRAVRGPFDIQIMPLDFCNLNCGFCPIQAVPEAVKEKHAPRFKIGKLKMEWRLFERIIEGLKELGEVERAHLTGGEPLLHPDIVPMIAALKSDLGTGHVAVVSNGIALRGIADSLIEAGMDRLNISINSVVPKTRAALSQGELPATYKKIIEGLKEFGVKRKRDVTGFALSSVLTNLNYQEVRAQFDLARETGADSVTFLPLMAFQYDEIISNRDLMLNTKQFSRFLKEIDRIQAEAERAGVWVGYGGRRDDGGTLKVPAAPKLPCYAGFSFSMFWPDGSVRLCCNCEESMGNIFRHSLSEIWHSEKYARFRIQLLQYAGERAGCLCAECGYLAENKELFQRIKGL